MKKLNFIFTGRFLKLWYLAFAVVIGLMLWDRHRLQSVQTYTLVIYDSKGMIVNESQVSRSELAMSRAKLPFTKCFIPNK